MIEIQEQICVCKRLVLPLIILTGTYILSIGCFLYITEHITDNDYPWIMQIVISVLSVAYLLSIIILWRYNIESQKTIRTKINQK